jgi:hypothetical protein
MAERLDLEGLRERDPVGELVVGRGCGAGHDEIG